MPQLDAAKSTRRTATTPHKPPKTFALPDGDGWFTPASEKDEYIKVEYYGREGSTKTTSVASMANVATGRILMLNAEAGFKTKPLIRRGIEVDRIMVYPPDDPAHAGHKFFRAEIDSIFRRIKSDLEKDPGSWFGTTWDSLSKIVTQMLDEARQNRVAKLAARFGEDHDKANPFFTDRDDYGVMSQMVRDLFQKFLDLPCHFAATSLMRRVVDEDTKKTMYGPAVNPALGESILGGPDIVVCTVGEDDLGPARGLTRGNSRFRAKDRFGILPTVMVEPTFERVYRYFTDELIEQDDPLQKLLTSEAAAVFESRGGKKAQAEPEPEEADEDDDDD